MSKRRWVYLIVGVALLLVTYVRFYSASLSSVTPAGKLKQEDIADIQRVLKRGRNDLLMRPVKSLDLRTFLKRLRERLCNRIESITSENGEYAVVKCPDRWDSKLVYDFDFERSTNGIWTMIGHGYVRKGR